MIFLQLYALYVVAVINTHDAFIGLITLCIDNHGFGYYNSDEMHFVYTQKVALGVFLCRQFI